MSHIIPEWGELKITFSMDGCLFLSDKDLEKYKKAEWVEGDLIEDSLRIVKEELFKKILKMGFEEFKTHLTITEK